MEIMSIQPMKEDEANSLIEMMHHLTWFYRMGLRDTAEITYPEFNTSKEFGDRIEVLDV